MTADDLREILDYDPITGIFRWRWRNDVQLCVNRRLAGKIAGGPKSDGGYTKIRINGQDHQAHRLAWLHVYGEWPLGDLDHRDMVGTHNWIANLRPATRPQNVANTGLRITNVSGAKGVHWDKCHQRWRVRITLNGKKNHLGYFHDREVAAAVYATAAEKFYGEFARTA